MTAPILYGIPNCDTVKKARAWLDDAGVAHAFHDFKKHGVTAASLARWNEVAGWETLLNRKGTTWRRLDEATKAGVTDAASAATLMTHQPSVIKRPVVDWPDGSVSVGFTAGEFARRQAASS